MRRMKRLKKLKALFSLFLVLSILTGSCNITAYAKEGGIPEVKVTAEAGEDPMDTPQVTDDVSEKGEEPQQNAEEQNSTANEAVKDEQKNVQGEQNSVEDEVKDTQDKQTGAKEDAAAVKGLLGNNEAEKAERKDAQAELRVKVPANTVRGWLQQMYENENGVADATDDELKAYLSSKYGAIPTIVVPETVTKFDGLSLLSVLDSPNISFEYGGFQSGLGGDDDFAALENELSGTIFTGTLISLSNKLLWQVKTKINTDGIDFTWGLQKGDTDTVERQGDTVRFVDAIPEVIRIPVLPKVDDNYNAGKAFTTIVNKWGGISPDQLGTIDKGDTVITITNMTGTDTVKSTYGAVIHPNTDSNGQPGEIGTGISWRFQTPIEVKYSVSIKPLNVGGSPSVSGLTADVPVVQYDPALNPDNIDRGTNVPTSVDKTMVNYGDKGTAFNIGANPDAGYVVDYYNYKIYDPVTGEVKEEGKVDKLEDLKNLPDSIKGKTEIEVAYKKLPDILKEVSSDTVKKGDTITYTLTIDNSGEDAGDYTAERPLTVKDTIPEGLKLIKAESDRGTIETDGREISVNGIALAKGDKLVITITAEVEKNFSPDGNNTLINQAKMIVPTVDGDKEVPSNETKTYEYPTVGYHIKKTRISEPKNAEGFDPADQDERVIQYQVEIFNDGDVELKLSLNDVFESGAPFTVISTNPAEITLPVQKDPKVVHFTAILDEHALADISGYQNTVTSTVINENGTDNTYTYPDPQNPDNTLVEQIPEQTSDALTPVKESPAIKLTKTADKKVYKKGETATYTITVSNTGNIDVLNAEITDQFANASSFKNGKFVSAVEVNQQDVFIDLSNDKVVVGSKDHPFKPGQKIEITFTAEVVGNMKADEVNTVTAENAETPNGKDVVVDPAKETVSTIVSVMIDNQTENKAEPGNTNIGGIVYRDLVSDKDIISWDGGEASTSVGYQADKGWKVKSLSVKIYENGPDSEPKVVEVPLTKDGSYDLTALKKEFPDAKITFEESLNPEINPNPIVQVGFGEIKYYTEADVVFVPTIYGENVTVTPDKSKGGSVSNKENQGYHPDNTGDRVEGDTIYFKPAEGWKVNPNEITVNGEIITIGGDDTFTVQKPDGSVIHGIAGRDKDGNITSVKVSDANGPVDVTVKYDPTIEILNGNDKKNGGQVSAVENVWKPDTSGRTDYDTNGTTVKADPDDKWVIDFDNIKISVDGKEKGTVVDIDKNGNGTITYKDGEVNIVGKVTTVDGITSIEVSGSNVPVDVIVPFVPTILIENIQEEKQGGTVWVKPEEPTNDITGREPGTNVYAKPDNNWKVDYESITIQNDKEHTTVAVDENGNGTVVYDNGETKLTGTVQTNKNGVVTIEFENMTEPVDVGISFIEKKPEISINKSAGQETVKAGDNADFFVQVQNTGEYDLVNVIVTDNMMVPDYMSGKFIAVMKGDSLNQISEPADQYLIESLKVGESVTLLFRAAVPENAENDTIIKNTAYVDGEYYRNGEDTPTKLERKQAEANVKVAKETVPSKDDKTDPKKDNPTKNSAATKNTTIKTGDSTALALYIGIFALALAVIAFTIGMRSGQNNQKRRSGN